jgi:hypothetical protein
MADTRKPAQLQPFTLAGSGTVLGAVEVTLSSFNDIDGNALTMADLGTKAFGTLEPGSQTQEEQMSFTGISLNADGTVTLTGVKNVEFLSPYTETVGLQKIHAGGVRFVISNTSGFYSEFANVANDETVTGHWTFDDTPTIVNQPVNDTDTANKVYVDNVAVSGAPNANETTKGIVQIATNAQMGAGTSNGSTGARLVPPNDQLVQVSSGAPDANKLPTLGAGGILAQGFIPTIPISKGGTGATTKTTGFDALSPTTTKGDLITNDGVNNVRQGVGTDGQVLSADSSQANGIKWSTPTSLGVATSFAKAAPATTINSTGTQNILTISVPSGTLGSTGVFKGHLFFNNINVSTTSDTWTVGIRYGSTTIVSTAMAFSSNGAKMLVDFTLQEAGTTSSQVADMTAFNDHAALFTNAIQIAGGSGSENAASTLNLLITVTYGGAGSTHSITLDHYDIELV